MINKKLFDIAWAGLSDESKFELYEAAYNEGYIGVDDEVYSMDGLDEILYDCKASDIADMCFYGNFNPNDEYFKFNEYGNLESISTYNIGRYCDDYSDDIYDYLESEDCYGDFSELYDVLDSLHAFDDEEE